MALTDTAVKALKAAAKPTKHSDGGGLHILVNPTGSKLWRMAYRYDGKQNLLAFGAYPAVSLADARRKRDEAKALLAKGTDPAHNLKMEKIAQAGKQCADLWTDRGRVHCQVPKVRRSRPDPNQEALALGLGNTEHWQPADRRDIGG